MKSAIALLMMLAPLAAHGQLLKCVSKDGRVEYSSQCPPDTTEIQTGIRNVPSASPPAATQKSLAEREADFKKRQMEGGEAQKKEGAKAAEMAQNRENCERARSYLKSLQEGQRIAQIDPRTGERIFIEDPARPAEIAKAQQAADSWCK